MASVTHIGSEAAFDKLISGATPVLVDFWASWCGPCRMIAPFLDELAAQYAGKIIIAKVDVDDQGDLAQRFHVSSIPALFLFKKGNVVDTAIGARPKAALEDMIKKVL